VARNVIKTFGSECFNVKENAHDNEFADNTCAANAEPVDFNGSNVELRGYANIVRNNTISDSSGYSVKISSDARRYDNGRNVVRDNCLTGASVGLKLDSAGVQGSLCGTSSTPGRRSRPCRRRTSPLRASRAGQRSQNQSRHPVPARMQ
jgi:hypothetical protein